MDVVGFGRKKIRIGEGEGETVVGKNHQGALGTLVERKCKLTMSGKVDRYNADAVVKTIISLMELLPRRIYTLTFDNGKEFASLESVAETIQINVDFADPYSAWQRGLNENTNGLIRQYVPKGCNVRILTDEQRVGGWVLKLFGVLFWLLYCVVFCVVYCVVYCVVCCVVYCVVYCCFSVVGVCVLSDFFTVKFL